MPLPRPRLDPSRLDPSRLDPSRLDPSRLDPSRLDPSRLVTLRRAALGVALGAALAGCEGTIDVRGYVPNEELRERLPPGLQTRQDVNDLLGTPSTVAVFKDETWLYITRKTKTVSFFTPTVLEQQVVAVDFDEKGVIADVRRYELADGKVINHVSRKTPSPGKELSFIEQLVGNVGKFAGGGLAPGQGAPGTTRSPR
jgi:outer membrane protein assembly factor BamE (lipoprotein component of BamABCDE complex)